MCAAPIFDEKSIPELHGMMRAMSFATVVATGPDGLMAVHLPVILHTEAEGFGLLRGHLGRKNPFWQAVGGAALVIFTGPQGYISPQWYPSKQAHGRVVPTWNYVAVHASVQTRAVTDSTWLRAHLGALTDAHESGSPAPWAVTDAPADFIDKMIESIVGIEMRITRLEGIKKLSQNRSPEDQAGVLNGLDGLADVSAVALAQAMRAKK